jgi:pimeloyl-ACP methyl ester carboxylesterase
MEISELDRYRKTAFIPSGEVSYLDVPSGRASDATALDVPSGRASDATAENGPAALFVHGVGTNAYLWRNLIDLLGADRRCIALDLPLHGQSPAGPDHDFTLAGLASLLEEFCAELALTEVDLVAHDTGGAVAQIFAARHPERLRTFCLTNCDTHDNVPPEAFKPTVDLAAAGAISAGAPALLADIGQARSLLFGTGYEDIGRLGLDVVRSFLEPILGTPERARQFERFLLSLHASDLLDAEPDLARLTVPTLVAWGTADVFFDLSWAYWLGKTIPGVTEVAEIDGGMLFFPDERADALAPPLRRLWSVR